MTTKRVGRAKRRLLTSEEKIEMALARFPKGEGLYLAQIKALKDRFHRDPAVISRAIASAFKEGLVTVARSTRPFSTPKQVPDLEVRMRERFPKLHAAYVIETEEDSDEELHRRLGDAMAENLVRAQPFRDGDVVGVGNGRGVAYTVEALMQRHLPFRSTSVTLTSLTGSLQSGPSWKYWFDSDLQAAQLSTCFAQQVTLNLVRHPLIYPTREAAETAKARTCLDTKKWKQPNVALLGVGVHSSSMLADLGRSFFIRTAESEVEQEPSLVSVRNLFDELTALVSSMEPNTSVATICSRLLFIPPSNWKNTDRLKTHTKRLLRLLDEINEKFVTVSDEQIQRVAALMLVAGSESKVPAIKEVLDHYSVHRLCTDASAARKLLAL